MNRRRLEELVLARLVASKGRAPAERDVKRSLWPFVRHTFSPAEWSAELERLLDKLDAAGELSRRRLAITAAGRTRVLAAIGVKTLPKRIGWRELVRDHLAPRAAGGARHIDELRARLIARHHRLPRGAEQNLARAVDALVWRELGIESSEALSLAKIRRSMLARVLGSERPMKLADQRRLLAARAAGAANGDDQTLRAALLRAWLAGDDAASSESSKSPGSLASFAGAVHEAAASPEVERFGDTLVFIASVWRRLREDAPSAASSLEEFKRRLVDANRAGLVRLQRADLVGAMDRRVVADSETRYLNATFHFVECGPGKDS